MPDNKATEQEPSIEEILASIRQIIADDDEGPAPEPAPAPKQAAPAPAKAPAPPPVLAPKEDVLELTDVLHESIPKQKIEIDLADAADEPPAEREVAMRDDPQSDESILTDHAAHAALSGFSKLASRTPIERDDHDGGITLEDIARDMMRPLLKDWLDRNLPPLIEKLVQKELQKIAREAREK